jgi:hypothetical protein
MAPTFVLGGLFLGSGMWIVQVYDMEKSEGLKFLALAALVILAGCKPPLGDESCTINVTSVANINNATGRELNLNVCVPRGAKPNDIQVHGQQSGNFNVETHTQEWIKTGGPANACDAQNLKSAIFLTAASFGQVTLCHQNGDASQVTIVEVGQQCPSGSTAQSAPIADSCL